MIRGMGPPSLFADAALSISGRICHLSPSFTNPGGGTTMLASISGPVDYQIGQILKQAPTNASAKRRGDSCLFTPVLA
jgi:hypothetical protein